MAGSPEPVLKKQISLEGVLTAAFGLMLGFGSAALAGVADWTKLQARVTVLEAQLSELRVDAKGAQASVATILGDLKVMQSQLSDIRAAVVTPSRRGSLGPDLSTPEPLKKAQ